MQTDQIKSFRDLKVWQGSCSIPNNIAEDHNRKATRVFLNHMNIALGSEGELETQLEVALRLKFCDRDQLLAITERRARVGRMLHGLSGSLKRRFAAEAAAFSASVACALSAWWVFASGSRPPLW